MPCSSRWIVFALAAMAVLCLSTEAWAWGAGTHIKLANDLASCSALLPAAVAGLLARFRRMFFYGNVATDVVFAKKMSRVKQICHQWRTGFSLLDAAESDAGRAFAYGYLAHLAADTVAHNKFLPRQMAVSRSTVTFGHVYWEVRADAVIRPRHWRELQSILNRQHDEPLRMLEAHLRETMLSFAANEALFRRMSLLTSVRAWRRSVMLWSRLSRFEIDHDILAGYHAECLDRILDVLTHGRSSAVLHEDPNGNLALSHARVQRRHLRQLRRARLPDKLVIQEAAAGLAPTPKNSIAPSSKAREPSLSA